MRSVHENLEAELSDLREQAKLTRDQNERIRLRALAANLVAENYQLRKHAHLEPSASEKNRNEDVYQHLSKQFDSNER